MEVGNTIVTISVDGGPQQNATTINSAEGTWSAQLSFISSQGKSHTVQAFTTDPFGNTATFGPITFIVECCKSTLGNDALTNAIILKYFTA